MPIQNPVLVNKSQSRERLQKEKEIKMLKREKELERIRLENIKEREHAHQRHENQYRQSTGNVLANQMSSLPGGKDGRKNK